MMRALLLFTLISYVLGFRDVMAAQNVLRLTSKECKNGSERAFDHVVKTICNKDRMYQIFYNGKRGNIVVTTGRGTTVLHNIPAERDPGLVGTDSIIGFLPDRLQPYKNQDILVYFSSIRTNSGGGGGQCGSGAETYLNFLDIGQSPPKVRSSLLVGSCNEPIEIVDQEMGQGKFGDISVVDQTLSLNFLFYRRLKGNTNGKVSSDFKRFLFK